MTPGFVGLVVMVFGLVAGLAGGRMRSKRRVALFAEAAAFDGVSLPTHIDVRGVRVLTASWRYEEPPLGDSVLVQTGDPVFDEAGQWWVRDPAEALAWLDASRRRRWVEIRARCGVSIDPDGRVRTAPVLIDLEQGQTSDYVEGVRDLAAWVEEFASWGQDVGPRLVAHIESDPAIAAACVRALHDSPLVSEMHRHAGRRAAIRLGDPALIVAVARLSATEEVIEGLSAAAKDPTVEPALRYEALWLLAERFDDSVWWPVLEAALSTVVAARASVVPSDIIQRYLVPLLARACGRGSDRNVVAWASHHVALADPVSARLLVDLIAGIVDRSAFEALVEIADDDMHPSSVRRWAAAARDQMRDHLPVEGQLAVVEAGRDAGALSVEPGDAGGHG